MRFPALTLFAFLLCAKVFAFESGYLTFDQPEGWLCERAQGIFICQSGNEAERKESVVLVLATLASEGASIENYEQYLGQSRPMDDDSGKQFNSEVRYVRKRNINGKYWVDSLQFNSELPGYWARYLATVGDTPNAKLEILVTYVVSDEKFRDMAPQFERMVSSLKPVANLGLNAPTRQGDAPVPNSDLLSGKESGPSMRNLISDRLKKKDGSKKPTGDEEGNGTFGFLAILAVGVVAVVILVRRMRKKKAQAQNQNQNPPSATPPTRRLG